MIWNCPHCQNALTLLESQVQEAWKFVRCLHCGGFSMARKYPVPATAQATSRKPVVIPATRRMSAAKRAAAAGRAAVPPPFRFHRAKPKPDLAFDQDDPSPVEIRKIPIPEPLPELSAPRHRALFTPILAATFATLVVVLGVRLHRLSQVTRYAEYAASLKQPIPQGNRDENDLLEPPAELPSVSLPTEPALPQTGAAGGTTRTLIDQLRQSSFATERTGAPDKSK